MRALALVCLIACAPPNPAAPPKNPRNATAQHALELAELVGTWRWSLKTQEAGTTRVETEAWTFAPKPGVPTQLVGRYARDVEVRSDDRVPFECNQRPIYHQRAQYEVTVEVTAAGYAIRETDYRTEPGPCDHGFRHLGAYAATVDGARMTLAWDGGKQVLWHTDDKVVPLPAPPWASAYDLAGAWRWDATSYDEGGNLRDEHEWWELTRRSDSRIDATYRRRVTIRSANGAIIPCAGAPSWSFDDAYILDGQREEEHWHFHELAADPGDHPCLAATPHRSLDEATAEQLGDALVLEWRGKRHQVLYRPE